MSEAEFTGERVIPGLVDADLFNEHRARYRFAAWFLEQRTGALRILDAACGAGYGARELSARGRVMSLDIAPEAVTLARGVTDAVVRASCEALPFADGSFDAVAAFETIEHLRDAPAFLNNARAVLRDTGVLLVSTPNRAYYAEARAAAGPNPFHTREYTYEEFRAVLEGAFPYVRLWTQNHTAGIVFAPAGRAAQGAVLEAGPDPKTAEAHFFLAACSPTPLDENRIFAWIPDSGNVLRERERHIARLQGELGKKDHWLNDLHAEHAALQKSHAATEAELRTRNQWAESLNQELAESRAIIQDMERDIDDKREWVARLESDLGSSNAEIARLQNEQAALNRALLERTKWARANESEKDQAIAAYRNLETSAELRLSQARAALEQAEDRHADQLRMIAASRWVRLGRKLKVGPEIG